MSKLLYEQVVGKWGVDAQLTVATEELSELIKEICKYKRGEHHNIAEEVADVEIMCEQLRFIFDCDEAVNDWKKYKLDRLERKLQK